MKPPLIYAACVIQKQENLIVGVILLGIKHVVGAAGGKGSEVHPKINCKIPRSKVKVI